MTDWGLFYFGLKRILIPCDDDTFALKRSYIIFSNLANFWENRPAFRKNKKLTKNSVVVISRTLAATIRVESWHASITIIWMDQTMSCFVTHSWSLWRKCTQRFIVAALPWIQPWVENTWYIPLDHRALTKVRNSQKCIMHDAYEVINTGSMDTNDV